LPLVLLVHADVGDFNFVIFVPGEVVFHEYLRDVVRVEFEFDGNG
jgi:hypothetical protein